MPRHDNNDEPQRRRQQDGENRHQRPTQDRPNIPGLGPQMPGDAHLPAGPNDQPRRPAPDSTRPNRAPDLDRASGGETRDAIRGGNIPDMRHLMNIVRPDQPGDISDDEARRLAGLDANQGNELGDARPVPQEPNTLPAVTRHEVANISQAIQTTGMVYPKWHSVAHLPGFQHKEVRGMMGDLFRMFTTTPQHELLTISTIVNSKREVGAVLNWLEQNANQLPDVEINFAGYNLPDVAEVREYQTENTRFHAVRDSKGWHIYAYPEGTAVSHSNNAQLSHNDTNVSDNNDDEYDDYGAPIKRLKEETQMTFTSLSEQLRSLTNKLDQLSESSFNLEYETILDEAIDQVLSEASSLQGLIGQYPGGMELVRALHKRFELAAGKKTNRSGRDRTRISHPEERPGSQRIDPVYEPIIGAANVSQMIKFSIDNFLILVGEQGCAAVKVDKGDYQRRKSAFEANPRNSREGKVYNPATDNQLQWRVLWSTGGGVDEEVAKYRMGRTDRSGGSEGTTGTPNLLDVLGDRIGYSGYPKKIFKTVGAVEHSLRATRASYKDSGGVAKVTDEQIAMKIKPIIQKMVQNTIGQVMNKASRFSAAGNFADATKFSQTGEKLQALLTAMDVTNPDFTYTSRDRYSRGPMGVYFMAVEKAVDSMTNGKSEEETNQIRAAIVQGRVEQLGVFLNLVRDNLLKAGTLSRY